MKRGRSSFLLTLGAMLLSAAVAAAQTLPPVTPPQTEPLATLGFDDGSTPASPKMLPSLAQPVQTGEAKKQDKPKPTTDTLASAGNASPGKLPDPLQTQRTENTSNLFAPAGQPLPQVWLSTDYLMWWVKSGPVNTPLLASGSLSDAIPGVLGQPHTQPLFGNSPMDFGMFSGLRAGAGVNLGSGWGVEGGYFLLEQRSTGISAASDAAGNPLLGRPFYDTLIRSENTQLTSNPMAGNSWAGNTVIAAHTRLQGYEANVDRFFVNTGSLRLAGLVGFRALDLNEDLSMSDTVLPPGTGNFTFLGNSINPAATAFDYDKFQTINHFYGGQMGMRLAWIRETLTLALAAKVALGTTQQQAAVSGASALLIPGLPPTVAPGGLLAQTSNIGSYFRNQFSVVPEGQVNVGWQIRPWLNANLGYTFLYWSGVARPGDQIDRNVNQSLQPFGVLFGKGTNSGPPFFAFHNSDFWAQGLNFGLLFSY